MKKNEQVKKESGASFEEIVYEIKNGNLLDMVEHPNKERYKNQKVAYVKLKKYVYAVPFIEKGEAIFLKTAFPSREAVKKYFQERKKP